MNTPTFDPVWNIIHRERPWGGGADPRVLGFIDKYFGGDLRAGQSIRILDLGTGYGAQSFALSELGYWVDAIDASEMAIMRANRRKIEECLAYERLNLSCGDVADLKYSDAIFDAVTDVAVLECLSWENGRRAIDEVLRVLKPGGRLCSLTAAEDYDVDGIASPFKTRTMTKQELSGFYRGFVELFCSRAVHVDGFNHRVSWWWVQGRKPRIGE